MSNDFKAAEITCQFKNTENPNETHGIYENSYICGYKGRWYAIRDDKSVKWNHRKQLNPIVEVFDELWFVWTRYKSDGHFKCKEYHTHILQNLKQDMGTGVPDLLYDRPGISGTVTGNIVAELGVSFKTKRCNGQNDEEHRHDGKYLKIIKE